MALTLWWMCALLPRSPLVTIGRASKFRVQDAAAAAMMKVFSFNHCVCSSYRLFAGVGS